MAPPGGAPAWHPGSDLRPAFLVRLSVAPAWFSLAPSPPSPSGQTGRVSEQSPGPALCLPAPKAPRLGEGQA